MYTSDRETGIKFPFLLLFATRPCLSPQIFFPPSPGRTAKTRHPTLYTSCALLSERCLSILKRPYIASRENTRSISFHPSIHRCTLSRPLSSYLSIHLSPSPSKTVMRLVSTFRVRRDKYEPRLKRWFTRMPRPITIIETAGIFKERSCRGSWRGRLFAVSSLGKRRPTSTLQCPGFFMEL